MIEVNLTTIITVVGAIISPLLIVIRMLYTQVNSNQEKLDLARDKAVLDYNAMRDKMQDKIDATNKIAADATSQATTALGSMSAVLVSVQATQKEQADKWQPFRDDIIKSIREAMVK